MVFPWELEVTPALSPELTASKPTPKPTPGDCLTRELGTSGTEHGTATEASSISYETADKDFL